jgi:hypothetical protein
MKDAAINPFDPSITSATMIICSCQSANSLNVENVPTAFSSEPAVTVAASWSNGRKDAKVVDAGQTDLFGGGGE